MINDTGIIKYVDDKIFCIYYSVPPKIDYVGPSTRVDVSKGASIKLECKAQGNPIPKIVWSRKVRNY